MTEHINLETVEAYLASIVLEQGNLLPAPMVIVSDDTPLYDEPGVMEEMETAIAEDRPAKIDGEIIHIENYNTSVITVTFVGAKLDGTYRINVPRQLMQVGYMYNRLLHSPACAIVTESESKMNKDFASDNLSREALPPLPSEDVMVRLHFPKDIPEETRLEYNYVLNNLRTDFTEGLSKEELKEIAPKIRLVIDAAESASIRGDVINMFMGLMEGSEDALVELYEYAEQVDTAKNALDKSALLTPDERKAVIIFEYIASVALYLHPANLLKNLEAIEAASQGSSDKEEEKEEDDLTPELGDLFSEDFESSLNEIITEYRQENPDTVTINEESTYEERVEYLSLPSNLIPLMGGLVKLSDRLNIDLFFSTDWNRNDVTEEDYVSRGEFLIILALLAVQRMQMFGKSIDVADGGQEMKSLCLSLSIEALTQEKDIRMWFLKSALLRAAKGDNAALNEFLTMTLVEIAPKFQIQGPFGQIMHWFGHVLVEGELTKAELSQAFSHLPIVEEFVETVFEEAEDAKNNSSDDDDDDDDDDEEGQVCFVTEAIIELPFEEEPNLDLSKQVTEALVIFAELSLSKDDKETKKGTPEWEESMGTYLLRVLSDD